MDADATQAIFYSDDDDDDTNTENRGDGERKPVAFLKVLAQKDIPTLQRAIFDGENFIGRHDSNSVHLPYKALSKQHACIEVQGSSHLIYDMGSRNRTRRGKLFLKRNVRYELRDDDTLIFGDLRCQYVFHNVETASDSGSETDSDLMLQPPDSDAIIPSDDKFNPEPTQPCVESPRLQFKTPKRLSPGTVYAAESDDESPNKSTLLKDGDDSFISDSQFSARRKSGVSVVQESDSDTDIEADNTGTGPFVVSTLAQTQAVVSNAAATHNVRTLAVEDMATLPIDNSKTQSICDMETQAIGGAATQDVGGPAPNVDVENAATLAVSSDDFSTQAYDADSDSSDSGDASGLTLHLDSTAASSDFDGSPVKRAANRSNVYEEPTQPCDGVVSDSDTDIDDCGMEVETQAAHPDGIDEMATVPVSEGYDEETDDEDEGGPKKPDDAVMTEEDIENMATVPISGADDGDDTDASEDEDIAKIMAASAEEPTLAISDIAGPDDPKDGTEETVKKNEPLITYALVKEEEREQSTKDGEVNAIHPEMESTQSYGNSAEPKRAIKREEDAPDRHSDDWNATQPYGGHNANSSKIKEEEEKDARCYDIEATQPYGASTKYDDDDEKIGHHSDDDGMQGATQPYGNREMPERHPNPTEASHTEAEIEATQPYGSGDGPKRSPEKVIDDGLDSTLPYGAHGNDDMDTEDSEVEGTQAYGVKQSEMQVEDSQEDEGEPQPSSRFPNFQTSPSRSCLRQCKKPNKSSPSPRARRVTFEPPGEEENSEEVMNTRQTRGRNSKLASSIANKARTRSVPDAGTSDCSPQLRESIGPHSPNQPQTAMTGQKRRPRNSLAFPGETTASTAKSETTRSGGKRTRRNKTADVTDGAREVLDNDEVKLTVMDCGITRKKEFDEGNPRPSSRRGSKASVDQERKLSNSSVSSVSDQEEIAEGRVGKRKRSFITKLGKKIRSIRTGGKTNAKNEVECVKPSLIPDGPNGDDESDETASISSNASSIKDLTDLEITTRTRKRTGVRQTKCEIVEEQDGPKATNYTRSKRRLVLVEKMKIKDEPNSQDEESTVLGTRRSERWSKEKRVVASKSSSRGKLKDETIVAQESDESRIDSDPAPASRNRGGRKKETCTDSQNDTGELMEDTTSRQRSKRKTAGGKASAVDDSLGEKHRKSAATTLRKVEAESATEPNSAQEGTFVVPKPVTRTARQKRLRESTAQEESSALEDSPMDEPPETRKRGRKGTAVAAVTTTATTKPEEAETTVGRGRRGRKSTPPTITVTEDKTPKPAKSPTTEGTVAQKETDQESNKRGRGRNKRGEGGSSVSPAKKARQSDRSSKEGGDQTSPSASFTRQSRHQGAQPALSPSLRRRSSDVKPRVLFTGVQDDSWQKTVTGLGGELMDSVHDCSHLVTDKVRRTVKFLCCLAQGVLIVTPEWLEKSKSSRAFVDPIPFLLKDKAAEKQHGFSLSASLQKAGQHRLLRGYKVHVTPGVKPEPPQMKDIIKCAGGEYLTKFPSRVGPQTVVVSCDDDRSSWSPASRAGIPVVSSEFILTGILTQEIMLAQYKLQ